jgi:hypothetical protein
MNTLILYGIVIGVLITTGIELCWSSEMDEMRESTDII